METVKEKRKIFPILDGSLVSLDTHKEHLTDYDIEYLLTRPYKPKLLVFETHYTSPDAWAHTEPERRVICILPPERRDPYLPILDHEKEHNIDPGAPEGAVYFRAFDKARSHIRSRIEVEYR